MIITISDMWKNQQKMLDNDNQIKLSSLIVILVVKTAVLTRVRLSIRMNVAVWVGIREMGGFLRWTR